MRSKLRWPLGLLALALVLGGMAPAGFALAGGKPRSAPSVVLIVIDTARADHFQSYGYDRATTPHFREFAQDAILFERAYSTSCWTVPAHASLFTGLLPVTHGATQETQYLDDRFETLAERLAEAGYETVCLTNNPWVSTRGNLVQGFEIVEDLWLRPASSEEDGFPHATNERVKAWLASRDVARPFFLFINYIEPHWRYEAPDPYRKRFLPEGADAGPESPALFPMPRWYLRPDEIRREFLPVRTALYDAEVAYADAIIDDLFGKLRGAGVFDESLVVVTSDHGENLGDHGHQGHAFALYEPTIRIPLAVRRPGGKKAGTVRKDPVQLTDLFVTIARLAGVLPDDRRVFGYDLLAGEVPAGRRVVAEYYYPNQVLGFFPKTPRTEEAIAPYLRRIRSLQIGSEKLVWGSDGRHELFDLDEDPAELANRIDERPDRARALEEELVALVERLGIPGREPTVGPTLDEAALERLRSLGYLR